MASLLDRLIPDRSAVRPVSQPGRAACAAGSRGGGPYLDCRSSSSTPPVGLTEGAPAPRTFRANQPVQFEDEAATEAARQEAADSVEPVFVFDANAVHDARGDVARFFDTVLSAKTASAGNTTATIAAVASELDEIDEETIALAAALGEQELARGTAFGRAADHDGHD